MTRGKTGIKSLSLEKTEEGNRRLLGKVRAFAPQKSLPPAAGQRGRASR